MSQLPQWYVRVVECQQQGDAAYCYGFEPVNFVHDKAIQLGQYFSIDLPEHRQGMFVYTALPDSCGHFQMMCSNTDKRLKAKLEKGMTVKYCGPFGKGWPLKKLIGADVLIVAGGTGLAQLAPVIDYLIEQGQADSTTVIYGASSQSAQILSDRRQQWREKLLLVETLDNDGGQLQGSPVDFISTVLAEHDRQPQIVLTCGPDRMMQEVADLCKSLVISSNKIWFMQKSRMHTELCDCGERCIADERIVIHDPIRCYATLCENTVY